MDVMDLLAQYRSIQAIPEDVARQHGYQKIRNQGGGFSLRQIGAENPAQILSKKLALTLGVSPDSFKGRSHRFLRRVVRMMSAEYLNHAPSDDILTTAEFEAMSERAQERHHRMQNRKDSLRLDKPIPKDYLENLPYTSLLRSTLLGEPRYEAWNFFTTSFLRKRLTELRIDVGVWQKGLGSWFIECDEETMISEEDLFSRLTHEFMMYFRLLWDEDTRSGSAVLGAFSARCTNVMHIDDLHDALTSQDELKVAAEISLQRVQRKDNSLSSQTQELCDFHFRKVLSRLKSRQRSSKDSGVYRICWSTKHPLDMLTIGNDGSACIGIYLDDEWGIRIGLNNMAQYMADIAIQFLEIWRGRERVGFSMCFVGYRDSEAFLISNSVELNPKVEHDARFLTQCVFTYLERMREAAGFDVLAGGLASHNTAVSHGDPRWYGERLVGVAKPNPNSSLYSDISDHSKKSIESVSIYLAGEHDLVLHPIAKILSSKLESRTTHANAFFEEHSRPENTWGDMILSFDEMREYCEVVIPPQLAAELIGIKPSDQPNPRTKPSYVYNDHAYCGFSVRDLAGVCRDAGYTASELKKFLDDPSVRYPIAVVAYTFVDRKVLAELSMDTCLFDPFHDLQCALIALSPPNLYTSRTSTEHTEELGDHCGISPNLSAFCTLYAYEERIGSTLSHIDRSVQWLRLIDVDTSLEIGPVPIRFSPHTHEVHIDDENESSRHVGMAIHATAMLEDDDWYDD